MALVVKGGILSDVRHKMKGKRHSAFRGPSRQGCVCVCVCVCNRKSHGFCSSETGLKKNYCTLLILIRTVIYGG